MSHVKNCPQKVETRDRKSIVVLYFDRITREGLCPEIKAIREQKVDQLKASPIKVYDYYNPGKDKTDFHRFNIELINLFLNLFILTERQAVEYYSPAGAQTCN